MQRFLFSEKNYSKNHNVLIFTAKFAEFWDSWRCDVRDEICTKTIIARQHEADRCGGWRWRSDRRPRQRTIDNICGSPTWWDKRLQGYSKSRLNRKKMEHVTSSNLTLCDGNREGIPAGDHRNDKRLDLLRESVLLVFGRVSELGELVRSKRVTIAGFWRDTDGYGQLWGKSLPHIHRFNAIIDSTIVHIASQLTGSSGPFPYTLVRILI